MQKKYCLVKIICILFIQTPVIGISINIPGIEATFHCGSLVGLKKADGELIFTNKSPSAGSGIHYEGLTLHASLEETITPQSPHITLKLSGIAGFPDSYIEQSFPNDSSVEDLVIHQKAFSTQGGLWGVSWAIDGLPLEWNLLIPAHSGRRITANSPMSNMEFDYPMVWESQMVLLEKENHVILVWAEDETGYFKKLKVQKTPTGWNIAFITLNYAPFEEKKTCESVRWHIKVFEGDWREAARFYQSWMVEHFNPIDIANQQPAWVKDIRTVITTPTDISYLERVTQILDPNQTMIYLYNWRSSGYDRDYPTYDQPYPDVIPYIERAHQLGYRVMLHVNHFGCDPLNPLYEQFEPYQVRSPWGSHEKEWWLWEFADPVIKFAYINPAYKGWRDLFIERMVALCQLTGTDALHLDQTLCIYNDNNGLIDGMSMLQGNIALHREMREALPHIALSGEGLNEITYRYEAFCQRHAFGVDHTTGSYSIPVLQTAHPISSYLLRPWTIMYGYLGFVPPSNGQLYSAWREAYQYWGIIPTLLADQSDFSHPEGFVRQFYEELSFWQKEKVDIDMDGSWDAGTAFPFRTHAGVPVQFTTDRRLIHGNETISQTLFGKEDHVGPGVIPGWRGYRKDRIVGLEPSRWYPLVKDKNDFDQFHITTVPKGYTLNTVYSTSNEAMVRIGRNSTSTIRLADEIYRGRSLSQPVNAPPIEVSGELNGADGSVVSIQGSSLFFHPPYKVPGSGLVICRYRLHLPEEVTRFSSTVGMEQGSIGEGKSDGVIFIVRATWNNQQISQEIYSATVTKQALTLNLESLAGKEVTFELIVSPGLAMDPSYDWARWYDPIIESTSRLDETVEWFSPTAWKTVVVSPDGVYQNIAAGTSSIDINLPGGIFCFDKHISLFPFHEKITRLEVKPIFYDATGMVLESPLYGAASVITEISGESEYDGIFVHPPDNGRTQLNFPLKLPRNIDSFQATVGLKTGSKSHGAGFIVEINGVETGTYPILPGEWKRMEIPLDRWSDKPVVLSLITDSMGNNYYDWGIWLSPTITINSGESQIKAY